MDAEGGPAGEEVLAGVDGRRGAVARGREGLVDGGLDRGQFGVGHADEVEEVRGAVYKGDVEVLGLMYRLASMLDCVFSPYEILTHAHLLGLLFGGIGCDLRCFERECGELSCRCHFGVRVDE